MINKKQILLITSIFIIFSIAVCYAQQRESCVITSIQGTVATVSCPNGAVIRTESLGAGTGFYKVGDSIDKSALGSGQVGGVPVAQQPGVRQDRPSRDLSYPPYPGIQQNPGVSQNPGVPQSPGVQSPGVQSRGAR